MRYSPEVVDAVRQDLPPRCVIDGQIVIATDDRLDLEALLRRIHPADSRAQARRRDAGVLRRIRPSSPPTTGRCSTRRTQNDGARLVNTTAAGVAPVHLTAVTDDHALATEWFDQFEGAGPDGLVIKGADLLHRPGERVMQKVKHARTADCVLAGFRWHKSGPVVGSLLLGRYDVDGMLQHVGVVAFFTTKRRRELVDELAPLCIGDGDPHPWRGPTDAGEGERRRPGATSRWNSGKDLSFLALRPERVIEVRCDQLEGTRFLHAAQFNRWRPEREPSSCTHDQLERPVRYALADVLP